MYFFKKLAGKRLGVIFVMLLISSNTGYSSDLEKIKTETITVTADKREKNIQDIPGSLSALSDLEIEDAGISSIEDIHNYVPNFETYSTYSAGGYQSIRGQSNLLFSPSVGIYVDDVISTFGYGGVKTNLYDIERIEILRGPQGNLYGMNSAGGVINIITKKPGNYYEANARVGYGNYNMKSFKASVNSPLVENKLFARVSGSYKVRDSYIDEKDSEDHKEKTMAGRVQINWVPSDRTNILFTQSHDNYFADFDTWIVPEYGDFKIRNRGLEEKDDIDDNMYSVRLKHLSSMFELTSVTALIDNEKFTNAGKDFVSDGENLKHRLMDMDDKKWMQEIRFASVQKDRAFQWLIGSFYLNGVEDTYYNMRRNTGTLGNPTLHYTDDITTTEIKTNTFSLFCQADYTFFEKLTLTGGLRYDYDKRENDFYHINKGVVKGDYNDSISWDSYSPKISLSYRPNRSVMTYISAAKGYKAGGYHSVLGDNPETATFDPEYALSYETGVKSNWFDNKLIANLSLFYSTIDDIQIMYIDPVSYEFGFRNAAEAEIWGFELESVLRPLRGLQITGSFGLLESEFKEHKIKDYEGKKVPFAPEYNADFIVQYNTYSGLFVRGEAVFHGKSYFGEDNKYSQSEYVIGNAKAGYESEKWDFNFYVKNMFDKTYYTIFNKAGGVEKAVTGAPLTWGVEASLRF
jgi:iron complex outermembrane receptor protein